MALVVGAIAAGRTAWRVLLVVVAAGCVWEYLNLAPKRWAGVGLIVAAVGLMACLTREWALAMVLTVWANDVFAYITGVALGRHKMAPHVSPNKSWEGLVGGLIGAVAVSTAAGLWLGRWLGFGLSDGGWMVWAAFGLLTGLAAVGGDLAESALKRRAGVKDSGSVFPGHGGFLDRFDAMLGAAPVAFVFMKIFLQ